MRRPAQHAQEVLARDRPQVGLAVAAIAQRLEQAPGTPPGRSSPSIAIARLVHRRRTAPDCSIWRAKSPPRQMWRDADRLHEVVDVVDRGSEIDRSLSCITNGSAISPTTPSRSASAAQLVVAEVARDVMDGAAEGVADEHGSIAERARAPRRTCPRWRARDRTRSGEPTMRSTSSRPIRLSPPSGTLGRAIGERVAPNTVSDAMRTPSEQNTSMETRGRSRAVPCPRSQARSPRATGLERGVEVKQPSARRSPAHFSATARSNSPTPSRALRRASSGRSTSSEKSAQTWIWTLPALRFGSQRFANGCRLGRGRRRAP